MPIAILMPALSPTMKEGHLARWHKKEGDVVAPGDVIADIETDKATMEVEAVDEGVLARIVIHGGTENVPINTTIAWILEEGESLEHLPADTMAAHTPLTQAAEPATPAASSPQTPSALSRTDQDRIIASPLARRIAEQQGVDLATLQGTGPHGRIIKADVEEARSKTSQRAALSQKSKTIETNSPLPLDEEGLSPYTLTPHTTMRKVIARRLSTSKQTVPHFYVSMDCTLDALLKLRQEVNASCPDVKISVNDFVIRACALALQNVPETNVGWSDEGMRCFTASDVAVAVALEGGLITPIIRSAEKKSLAHTSAEMKSLIERAKQNKLKPEEFTGGSFSLSNLGMYGVKQFQAVINPPQACILAVGSGEARPIIHEGQIVPATVMNATLSVDHRVVDGVVGARFLQAFRDLIQTPLRLIL